MTKKGSFNRFLVGLAVLFIAVAVLSCAYLYYRLQVGPEPNEVNSVTKLPHDVRRTLEASRGARTPSEVSARVPIFLYHYVEHVVDKNDKIRISLNILPEVLRTQIDTLKAAGYTFITPNDLVAALAGKSKLPEKTVMLSFDDGYRDFYTDVFPILNKEQVKAVAYIVPDFLDRPNYMLSNQLEEVAKSPLVEIGAHTMDHLWLQGMASTKAQFQIAQSRKELQDKIHLPINSFAYPYGAFDLSTVQLVKDAGFTNAVATVPGIVHTAGTKYFFYRLRPGSRTGKVLLDWIDGKVFRPW